MRGDIPVEYGVPTAGVIANQPPHLVPPNALINGSNVFVDIDGLLKTRLGFSPVAPSMAVTERVQGLISDLDNTGVIVQVAGTTHTWQYFDGATWHNITGTPLNTSANNFVRFAGFPQSGFEWVYGVNGSDGLKAWHLGLATYNDVAVPFDSAIDIETLVNRIIVVNVVEGGQTLHQRVRWSAVNDGTSWPALAFADLADESDEIVGIKRTSRTSAVIYRTFSAWYMQGVPGDDANAFTFERIPAADSTTGPVSCAAIVSAEGAHYYLGLDGRVYVFDGISIYPISDRIDPLSLPALNTGFESRSWSMYLPNKRMLFFVFPSGSGSDPTVAIAYSLARQAFEPLMTFAEPLTCGATIQSSVGPTWLNWVPLNSTWPQVPYASWSSIPNANFLGAWVGTLAGNVHQFFASVTDNGVIIPYSAFWPLIRPSALELLQTDFMELYLQQASQLETLEADLLGYAQPFDTKPINLWSLAVELTDQSTFFAKAEPGPDNPGNKRANLLQLIIQSAGVACGFSFGGSLVSCYKHQRGDYLAKGNQ